MNECSIIASDICDVMEPESLNVVAAHQLGPSPNINSDRREHLLVIKLIEFHIASVKKHRPVLGIKIIIKFCLYERHLCLEQKIISLVVCYRTLTSTFSGQNQERRILE